jgi:hypothetical protein
MFNEPDAARRQAKALVYDFTGYFDGLHLIAFIQGEELDSKAVLTWVEVNDFLHKIMVVYSS